ncbi:hypothetical protein MBOVa_5900 [Mycoplasmopsis bovis 8790]|nr:hypothetical protein MBOVa_5900 [Mycoplasmopsis bovis 8790]
MNKKKLILIRGGLLFANSLPLIAASCKNNETKEPKKEPEMDAPIAPPADPGKSEPMHSGEPKVLKTDISSLKLEFSPTNNTNKSEVLELLKKQPKLENLTESDFDLKLEKKALLNREGLIVVVANPESQLVSGTLNITIKKLDKLIPREHKYSNDKTRVLEIGYDEKGRIKTFDKNVKEVPADLPEEIISLNWAFDRNLNEKIVNLEKWDTSNVESMNKTFFEAKKFNTDISSWKTNNVKDMSYMFASAESFNQNLDKWDTSNVTTMNRMFQQAKTFNGDVSKWDTKNVKDMSYMFDKAESFNNDISLWNVDNVTTMERMFSGAKSFNKPIFKLVNPKVTNLEYMFYGASKFNDSNISQWNTSSVTTINAMFKDAIEFNQDLSKWKTDKITIMSSTFSNAAKFNGNIKNWNTSNVTTMKEMFWRAQTFNQDIGNWDVKNVKDVTSMFFGAGHFDKSLKNWKFNTEPEHQNFNNGSKPKDLPTFKQPNAK